MPNARSTAAAGDAVTGMTRRSDVTRPGDRPACRSAVATAATDDSVAPNLGPNCPGCRNLPNSGELLVVTSLTNALSAAGSRTLSAMSRWSMVPAASGPSLTAPRGTGGGASAVSRIAEVPPEGCAPAGSAHATAPLSPRAPAAPRARIRLLSSICSYFPLPASRSPDRARPCAVDRHREAFQIGRLSAITRLALENMTSRARVPAAQLAGQPKTADSCP